WAGEPEVAHAAIRRSGARSAAVRPYPRTARMAIVSTARPHRGRTGRRDDLTAHGRLVRRTAAGGCPRRNDPMSDDSIFGSIESIGSDLADIGANAAEAAGNMAEGSYHMVASGFDQMANDREAADAHADASDANKNAFDENLSNIADDIGF